MRETQARKKILDLLARHEETIGVLYKTYAKRFPEMETFWSEFAREEFLHAAWIRKLDLLIDRGTVRFEPGRFDPGTLRAAIDYLESQIELARHEPIEVASALAMGLAIEEGILERHFFRVFSGDAPQFRTVLEKLADATKDHRERMQKANDDWGRDHLRAA